MTKQNGKERDSHRICWGSSYDRGLEILLKMWPDIKKEVSDATLYCFYGWDLFDIINGNNPASQAWKQKMIKLMEQPGITHLGRIGQGEVIKEHEKAGIWAYPTTFYEISCITAMTAQVYGSIPVVINYAALKDTVQYGIKVEGDGYDSEVQREFTSQLVSLLKDKKRQEEIRIPMMEWAKENFSWAKVAKDWTKNLLLPAIQLHEGSKR